MNNPPAFPTPVLSNDGMTLRDYFAANAMQALLNPEASNLDYDSRAKASYKQADAMLKAREQ